MIAPMIRPNVTHVESEVALNAKADKIKSINAESVFWFSEAKESDKTDL